MTHKREKAFDTVHVHLIWLYKVHIREENVGVTYDCDTPVKKILEKIRRILYIQLMRHAKALGASRRYYADFKKQTKHK